MPNGPDSSNRGEFKILADLKGLGVARPPQRVLVVLTVEVGPSEPPLLSAQMPSPVKTAAPAITSGRTSPSPEPIRDGSDAVPPLEVVPGAGGAGEAEGDCARAGTAAKQRTEMADATSFMVPSRLRFVCTALVRSRCPDTLDAFLNVPLGIYNARDVATSDFAATDAPRVSSFSAGALWRSGARGDAPRDTRRAARDPGSPDLRRGAPPRGRR